MKKQNTQQPEAINIEEVVGKSEAFILKYKMQIILAIAAIVVLVGGSILYQTYVSEPRAKEASEAIFQAQTYFAAQDFEKALNGDEQGNMGHLCGDGGVSSNPREIKDNTREGSRPSRIPGIRTQ